MLATLISVSLTPGAPDLSFLQSAGAEKVDRAPPVDPRALDDDPPCETPPPDEPFELVDDPPPDDEPLAAWVEPSPPPVPPLSPLVERASIPSRTFVGRREPQAELAITAMRHNATSRARKPSPPGAGSKTRTRSRF